MSTLGTGPKAGIVVAAAVVTAALGALISLPARNTVYVLPPGAPPKIAFPIIWTVLFLIAGVALAIQGLTAQTWTQWTSFGLLTAVVLGCFVWTYVYRASKTGAALYTGALLMLLLGGVFLGAPQPVMALWAPMCAWFIYATVLSILSAGGER